MSHTGCHDQSNNDPIYRRKFFQHTLEESSWDIWLVLREPGSRTICEGAWLHHIHTHHYIAGYYICRLHRTKNIRKLINAHKNECRHHVEIVIFLNIVMPIFYQPYRDHTIFHHLPVGIRSCMSIPRFLRSYCKFGHILRSHWYGPYHQ